MLRRSPYAILYIVLLLVSTSAFAGKEFVPPRPEKASAYACKDSHPTEKVTAAVDLYNTSPKDSIFITAYGQDGILPVYLIITNDGEQAITVSDMRAQLVTSGRTKMEALTPDDVYRRVAHISGSSTSPQRAGPIPLPGSNKNKKALKQFDEITSANFAAQAVEPHTTKAGFLFFDVQGVRQPVEGAHVYLTGVRDAGGSELMYFEIPTTPESAPAPGR